MSWWDEQCPARGAGLGHAHWNKCDPNGVHPADTAAMNVVGHTHPAAMCCHCEQTREGPKADVLPDPEPIAQPSYADHEYLWTIVGRCGRKGCGRLPTEHVSYRAGAEPGDCAVEHSSITAKLLIGDGGQQWARCPQCAAQVEPKLAKGEPGGRKNGIGRGHITDRQRERLITIANRMKFLDWLDARG